MKWLLKTFGKKLSVTIATFITAFANKKFNLGLEPDTMQGLIYMAMSYVAGQGFADGLSGGKTSSIGKN